MPLVPVDLEPTPIEIEFAPEAVAPVAAADAPPIATELAPLETAPRFENAALPSAIEEVPVAIAPCAIKFPLPMAIASASALGAVVKFAPPATPAPIVMEKVPVPVKVLPAFAPSMVWPGLVLTPALAPTVVEPAPSAKALEPIAVEPVNAVPPPVAVEPTPSARSKGLVAAPLKPRLVKSTSCADAPLGKRAIAPAAAATR